MLSELRAAALRVCSATCSADFTIKLWDFSDLTQCLCVKTLKVNFAWPPLCSPRHAEARILWSWCWQCADRNVLACRGTNTTCHPSTSCRSRIMTRWCLHHAIAPSECGTLTAGTASKPLRGMISGFAE
jgi:hypothetical protein